MAYITPTLRLDFSCPHCGAHAAQEWFQLYAKRESHKNRFPFIPSSMDEFDLDGADDETKAMLVKWVDNLSQGLVTIDPSRDVYAQWSVSDLNLSQCFTCKKIAVWRGRTLIHPDLRHGDTPNEDLNADIVADVNEAREILKLSPRGSAALLRLALQKLCKQLGKAGKNIDQDIKELVADGLSPHLQQAFDVVRVIGNEAVHPGSIDLRDNVETATALIRLINIVAQEMITNRRVIAELFETLPEGKKDGIKIRDAGSK